MKVKTADFAEMGRLIWKNMVCTRLQVPLHTKQIIYIWQQNKSVFAPHFWIQCHMFLMVPTVSWYCQIEEKGYTFRRDNFFIVSFASFVNGGSTLKEKNLFLQEQILSLKSIPSRDKIFLKEQTLFWKVFINHGRPQEFTTDLPPF